MNGKLGRKLSLGLGVVLLLVLGAAPVLPQAVVGVITGRVTDASGALIPGVEVTVSSPAMIGGARSAVTNESGVYRLTLLPPGIYRVEFALSGFKTLVHEGLRLTAGSTLTLNAELEVATVAETITVVGESPGVDLESAQVQTNFDERLLEDIPSGRTLRALATLVPGFYATATDVGGSGVGTGTHGSFRAYGDSGQYYFLTDGVYTGGHYSDFGAYSEIQIVPASKGADVPTPGVYFNAVIKGGSNELHGYVYSDYENDTFQSSNVAPKLKAQGVEGRKFSRFHSFNGEVGGPIIKDRIWFYYSHYDVYNGEPVDGLTDLNGKHVDYYTRLLDPTYKFTFQLTPKNKIDTMGQFGWKHQPFREANQFIPAEAARDQQSWSVVGNVKWQSILSPKATLHAQFSRWGWWWPSYARVRGQIRQADLTTQYERGSLNENYSRPTRWQWSATVSLFTDAGKGDHEFKFGYGGLYYHNQNEVKGYPGHQKYYYRSKGNEADPLAGWPKAQAFFVNPERVEVASTPYKVIDVGRNYNFYINDRWNIVPRFTFTWGIRYDYYDSFYPEHRPLGGPFAENVVIPARHFQSFPKNWVPRLSMVYDLTGSGKLAFKASYGRYYTDPERQPASAVNPAGGITKTYCAVGACPSTVPQAAAWDGKIPYIPDDRALISTSGGRDSDVIYPLKNSYLDEVAAGIDFEIGGNYAGRVSAVRKWDRDGWETINAALPYAAYTQSVIQTDPTDGKQYQIWSVPRTHPSFGKNLSRLVNVPGSGNNDYLGWEATLNRRMANNYQFMITGGSDFRKERCTVESFSTFDGYGCRGGMPDNPNEALYDPSLRIWETNFKAMGIWELPHGMNVSGSFRSQSGQPYGRQLRLRDANNTTVTLSVDKAKYKLPWLNLLDLRFSKVFHFKERQSMEAMFDLFNVNNTSAVTALNLLSGSTFQRPSAIPPGRIFRLGAKWKF